MNVPLRDVALMTRRLSDLIGGGLPMSKSLRVLSAQSENKNVRVLLKSIHQELGYGKSLSEALRSQNGTFGPIYMGVLQAGESSGNIEGALDELSELLEAQIETRQRFRAAIAYPLALLALSIAVCFFLTIFVIPRFETLFQDLGQRLPWPTRMLISVTVTIKKWGWIIAVLIAVVFHWLFKQKQLLVGKLIAALSSVPVLYDVIQTACLQRWTQAMASLLRGGVPVPEALWLSGQSVDENFFGPVVRLAIDRLREGRSLSSALSQTNFFPPMLCELVAAGEESGRLEKTFERLAWTYKRESELKIKLALSLLEPALVLFMGILVGFVAVAMLLPIFSMSANIR